MNFWKIFKGQGLISFPKTKPKKITPYFILSSVHLMIKIISFGAKRTKLTVIPKKHASKHFLIRMDYKSKIWGQISTNRCSLSPYLKVCDCRQYMES